MKSIIVIPTYDEAKNIERLIGHILLLHPDFELIIVDDNSPDGTGAIVDAISQRDPRVHVIHRPRKSGLGTAYIRGFREALSRGADLVFEMDADFSHDPRYLRDFLEASQKGDLVLGSRYINGVRVEGWRFRRLLLSKFANMYVSYMMVKPVWDFTGGFRCYRRPVLESIDLDTIQSDGYAFQIEMIHKTFEHGFKVLEIPILFRERENGYSKISKSVIFEALLMVIRYHAPIVEIFKHASFIFKDYREFTEKEATLHPEPPWLG